MREGSMMNKATSAVALAMFLLLAVAGNGKGAQAAYCGTDFF